MSNKNHCVSVRLKQGDLQKIGLIADRMGARNSDVIRFAIKTALNNLMPLHDEEIRIHRLLPLIIDHCSELCRHFDLDADQLDRIINAGAKVESERIHRHDIELLALCSLSPQHIQSRLQELTGREANLDEVPQLFKEYLINKYLNKQKKSRVNKIQHAKNGEPHSSNKYSGEIHEK